MGGDDNFCCFMKAKPAVIESSLITGPRWTGAADFFELSLEYAEGGANSEIRSSRFFSTQLLWVKTGRKINKC